MTQQPRYLFARPNSDGTTRFYFQPPQGATAKGAGWKLVPLHDQYGQPIRDRAAAIAAVAPLAAMVDAWRDGEPDAGPHRIDGMGRLIAPIIKEPGAGAQRHHTSTGAKGRFVSAASKGTAKAITRYYLPGQIGAMVIDYMQHPVFTKDLNPRTQDDYACWLNVLAEKFGTLYWPKLDESKVSDWLRERGETNGIAGTHTLYRTCRAFFSKCRLVYPKDHPGYVPLHLNPFSSITPETPTKCTLVWPGEALDAFVQLADEQGYHSIADAIVIMSRLGIRKQDWLRFPANTFDADFLAFAQKKTAIANVVPWQEASAVVARVSKARERREACRVVPLTFFHNDGQPYAPQTFRKHFNELRKTLAAKHPHFATRYYVGQIEGMPLAVPTMALQMRMLRHTCVTRLFDAGVEPEQIGGVTGHTTTEINDILKSYRIHTADQAAAALRAMEEYERRERIVKLGQRPAMRRSNPQAASS